MRMFKVRPTKLTVANLQAAVFVQHVIDAEQEEIFAAAHDLMLREILYGTSTAKPKGLL